MKTKRAKKAKPCTSTLTMWEGAVAKMNEAQRRRWDARRALTKAEALEREAERGLAVASLAAVRSGHGDHAEPWLVNWWNNFPTSPRGERPCAHRASEIPADAAPLPEPEPAGAP